MARRTVKSIDDEDEKFPRETLFENEAEKKRRERLNGLTQFDEARKLIRQVIAADDSFELKPSIVCDFNGLAIAGIWRSAGLFRTGPIQIDGSKHNPPEFELVPGLVSEMCDYVNDHAQSKPVHVASYLMWRINWIHPFVDGNGRTARTIAYIMLCVRLGCDLPGIETIPDQISSDKRPYYAALDAADRAWKDGMVELIEMEDLLNTLFARQLLSIHDKGSG